MVKIKLERSAEIQYRYFTETKNEVREDEFVYNYYHTDKETMPDRKLCLGECGTFYLQT